MPANLTTTENTPNIKKLLKTILNYTLKPYLKYAYLSSDRKFRYSNLTLNISSGIFHPGLFYSSKLLSSFIETLPINNSKLLDLGCGSGLLSLVAAEKGALVTAVDINQLAVNNTCKNAEDNDLSIRCFQSDLFDEIEGLFDYIIVNPPFYPKQPKSNADHAWYCGASHDYFERFFSQLSHYCEPECRIYMILSDVCDLNEIKKIADNNGYRLSTELKKDFLLETNYIFNISRYGRD